MSRGIGKRIRVNGVLYERVRLDESVSIPDVSEASVSRSDGWYERGDEVQIDLQTKVETNVFNGIKIYDVNLYVTDVRGPRYIPMASVTVDVADDGTAEVFVDTKGRGRRNHYLGDGITVEDAFDVVNDILSDIASGINLDDYEATQSFVKRRMTRTVTRRLSGKFEKVR